MPKLPLFPLVMLLSFFASPMLFSSYDGSLYDSTAYTECKQQPEVPLYGGGILKDDEYQVNSSSFHLKNLEKGTRYCFSIWIRISNADSPSLIRASLVANATNITCIGTVIANKGCWSFLKGGFVLPSPSISSTLSIRSRNGSGVGIEIASASLQPFTEQQWRFNQDQKINETRKRAVTIHVADGNGTGLEGAQVRVELVSRDFPFGSAIPYTIIANSPYQKWFVERFNAAVFENELKWDATEPTRGQVNYTIPDAMLEFTRSNQILVRGHNIFWNKHVPSWVYDLTAVDLQSAVDSRIQSLTNKYKAQFIHWDVNNEMLRNAFYEDRLGPNATLQFYQKAQQADPLAGLFMNEFDCVEGCGQNDKTTVDTYISRVKELQQGGILNIGIGLQGHFGLPSPSLARAVLDKFATLGLPIWITELDINSIYDVETQALYLEEYLREVYSHPGVKGIMLWTAMRDGACYKMCLTDSEYNNLPTGDVVDKLVQEWFTKVFEGQTDERGAYSFFASLGQYKVSVTYDTRSVESTFSVPQSTETRHFNIQV